MKYNLTKRKDRCRRSRLLPREEQALTRTIANRITEVIETTDQLISLVPKDAIGWRPPIAGIEDSFMTMGELLYHLVDCVAGCCATVCAATPALSNQLGADLIRSTDGGIVSGLRSQIRSYLQCVDQGLKALSDDKLNCRIKTYFHPEGETIAAVLFANLEHLLNHRYQLYIYLKML